MDDALRLLSTLALKGAVLGFAGKYQGKVARASTPPEIALVLRESGLEP